MRGVIRPLCVLALLQGICLAAGLWIHDRYLVSAARWSGSNRSAQAGSTTERDSGNRRGQQAAVAPIATVDAAPTSVTIGPNVADHLFAAMPAASAMAFAWTFGLQSVIAYCLLARVYGEHSRRQSKSDEQTWQNTKDLVQTRDAVIFGLAKLAESRDPETGQHLERIALYSTRLAAALGRDPKYRRVVTPSFIQLIGISSALHDIGKVAIEDSVLLKPGELTSIERFRMQCHAEVGAESIREIERRLGTSNFLEMAREIANSHHERWDGSGYPDKLAGDNIPLAARIVAIADVYDALSVRRIYKDLYPHRECVSIIAAEAGRQFDPDLVRVFLEIEGQFEEIAGRFADEFSHNAESSDAEEQSTRREVEESLQRLTPEQQALLTALAEPVNTRQPQGSTAVEA